MKRNFFILSAFIVGLFFANSCTRNTAPDPPTISGDMYGSVGANISVIVHSTDPQGDMIRYRIDWDDGSINQSGFVESDSSYAFNHIYSGYGTYYAKAQAEDIYGNRSDWSEDTIYIGNPPGIPSKPSGADTGVAGNSYTFSSSAVDPDGDSISIRFDWSDGSISDWSPFVLSGDTVSMSHSWVSPGVYSIRAQAKDINGATSSWSEQAQVVILNPGTKKWELLISNYGSSPTIDSNGTIYIGSNDGNLYAINPDGTIKWKVNVGTGWYSTSSPAIGSDGTIYIGSLDYNVYVINPDGTVKWKFKTELYIYSSPAIGPDGIIYVGSLDGNVYALNPDGTLKWKFKTQNIIKSSPAIGSDGTIYIGSYDGNLYAINPDGTEKWEFYIGSYINSSPVIGSDRTVYIGSDDGNLYAINPDGTKEWVYPISLYSALAICSDGTIYVSSMDDNLYALNPDGTEKWRFTTRGSIYASPTIGFDGTVYISSENILYALYGCGELADAPWPMFHHDLRHTGRQ